MCRGERVYQIMLGRVPQYIQIKPYGAGGMPKSGLERQITVIPNRQVKAKSQSISGYNRHVNLQQSRSIMVPL